MSEKLQRAQLSKSAKTRVASTYVLCKNYDVSGPEGKRYSCKVLPNTAKPSQ